MKKNKKLVATACGIAILTITTTVFSATNLKGTMAKIDVTTEKAEYSVDGGKTWSTDSPVGLKYQTRSLNEIDYAYLANEDGSVTVVKKSAVKCEEDSVVARINSEINKIDYSTDGGKTWGKERPEGLIENTELKNQKQKSLMVNTDGSISDAPDDMKETVTGIIAKIDVNTNNICYSTDGGITWSKERPAELK